MKYWLRPLVLFVAATSLCAAMSIPQAETAARRASDVKQALWITRWDWQGEAGLRQTIAQAAEAGFDSLLFQVRGAASTYWESQIEPWAEELGGADPGFDPLAVALAEAHARGLRLHAWINVVPAWWGTTPPRNRAHIYYKRPEWFWYDAQGNRQALCERFYVSLNPCLPEVRAYLIELCAELVQGYAIDGLHLDYLRLPNEVPALPSGEAHLWPQDRKTLAIYREHSGKVPAEDRAAWDEWRAAQVSELLRGIRSKVKAQRPELMLSAAVGPEVEAARTHCQDWPLWIREGLLDLVFPMNYSADATRFAERVEQWCTIAKDLPVVMGWMVANAEPEVRAGQLRLAQTRLGRSAAFAYYALWDSPNVILEAQDEPTRLLRAKRRAQLLPLLK